MKLYSSHTTPFGRKISVQILESGLGDRIETKAVAGTPLDPGSMPIDRNPLGKIPALDTPEGVLYDSRVISRYLDDLTGKGLYPAAPKLWRTLTLEATADGILDAAVLMAYELRLRPEALRYPEWLDGQWAKITRALDAIEENWMEHLAGPLDMAQIGLGCALEYLDFRHNLRGWREGRLLLAAWQAEFGTRASMQATKIPAA
ncbi:MAG: glutathione S-transferase family protein [Cypionkella sp.]